MKLWEYVQKETEAGLSPGSPCAVRGALSTRTGRGHLTLDKAQLVSGGGASIFTLFPYFYFYFHTGNNVTDVLFCVQ